MVLVQASNGGSNDLVAIVADGDILALFRTDLGGSFSLGLGVDPGRIGSEEPMIQSRTVAADNWAIWELPVGWSADFYCMPEIVWRIARTVGRGNVAEELELIGDRAFLLVSPAVVENIVFVG